MYEIHWARERFYDWSRETPTCQDLLQGTLGAVAGLVGGQHRHGVVETALHVWDHAAECGPSAAAPPPGAALHAGVEELRLAALLPGDVEHRGPTVHLALHVRRHTGGWGERREGGRLLDG